MWQIASGKWQTAVNKLGHVDSSLWQRARLDIWQLCSQENKINKKKRNKKKQN